MGFRDELEAAMARGDALQRQVEFLEQRLKSAGADDQAGEIRRLTDERNQARAELDRLNVQVRFLEEKLREKSAPQDRSGMTPLWAHNRSVTATLDFGSYRGLGVSCPQCDADGTQVELVEQEPEIFSYDRMPLAHLPAVCPRCLFRASYGWNPRPLTIEVYRDQERIQNVTVARAFVPLGNASNSVVKWETQMLFLLRNFPYGVSFDTTLGPAIVNGIKRVSGTLESGDRITCRGGRDVTIVVTF